MPLARARGRSEGHRRTAAAPVAVGLMPLSAFGAPERQQHRADHCLGRARLRGGALRRDPRSAVGKTRKHLDALVALDDPPDRDDDAALSYSAFNRLKSDPGRIGVVSVEREVEKLALIDALGLPKGLWRRISPELLARYRARAATASARELRRHRPPVRYALLSAYCWQRRRELIDSLVDLLIQVVHRLSVRAEKRTATEMVGELRHVEDKAGILFRIAEAALENPDGSVREVLFP